MSNKAAIKIIKNEVVVLDKKGKEVFRKPKTKQYISVANTIYMYHKYS